MQKSMTIVVEGMDLSGKSTAVTELIKQLTAEKYNVIIQKGHPTTNPLYKVLDAYPSYKFPKSAVLNFLYLVFAVLDGIPYYFQKQSRSVYITESYIYRCVAYGRAAGFRSGPWFFRWFRKLYHQFDLVVYLYAGLDQRKVRFGQRTDNNCIDELTLNPEFHQEMHTNYLLLLHNEIKTLYLDTASLSCEEIGIQILKAIKKNASHN
jgi:thymidylate kinase